MTESDFLFGTQKNNDRIEDRELEMTVDGEKKFMKAGDYLAAVNASGQAKMAAKAAKEKAAKKKEAETRKILLYLAAGGAAILLLTR